MKKFFNYVLLALVTICFALPLGGKAEAAKVAVVPLANHVAGDELAGGLQVYLIQLYQVRSFQFGKLGSLRSNLFHKSVL